ncbi:MAG: hypothetical protein ACFFF4_14855 [Candidatus Thorarchaeota archaeon]
MAVWHFAELYGGAALILAALLIIRYSRARSALATEDAKKAFRPLYLSAIALAIFGFGSISIYLEEIVLNGGLIELGTRYVYLLSFAIGVIMIAVAGVWILNNRIFYAIPVGSFVATIALILMAVVIDPANQTFYEDIGSLILSIVLILSGILFAWISKQTLRGTSASLAFVLFTLIGTIPRIYEVVITNEWSLLVIFFTLMGPAMVAYAFIVTEQAATFELVGYGAAFSAGILMIATISSLPTPLTPFDYGVVIFGAVAAMFALGTTAYLFGRWRESKAAPTFIYMLAFGAFYLSQMIGMFGASGAVPGPELFLYDFLFAGIALALIATAAIYATGRTSVALVPVVVAVLVLTVIALQFENSIGTVFLDNLILIIPALVVFLLPVPIFLAVWWRMRAAGSAAAGRPLGMAIGIVLFFLARLPPLLLGVAGLDWGYGAVLASFLVSWLAITGRLNRTPETQ